MTAGARDRVVGVDLGEKRIGLAWADTDLCLAVPACTIELSAGVDAVASVLEACREIGATRVVLGKPTNMDGSEGPAVQRVERFARTLRERSGMVVELQDERLTSAAVERSLIAADLSRRKRKGKVDRLAAQAILQSYMDAHASSDGEGTREDGTG
jgi:putative Holliday junction resolvase